MATTIVTKNSATSGSAPGAGALSQGELAVNVADKRLYTKDSGGSVVEVGTNPGGAVTFTAGSASAPAITTTGDTNTGIFFPAADTIAFAEGGAEAMRLDASGNLGVGVTPSAWQANNKAIQVFSGYASLSANNSQGTCDLAYNGYNTGSGATNSWRYANTGAKASLYQQLEGTHSWQISSTTGTAGNLITFTQAMTLDASGNLLVGTTSSSGVSGAAFKKGAATSCLIEISGGNGTPATDSLAIGQDASTVGYVYQRANQALIFGTNNTERMRIDNSGNLLLGYTSNDLQSGTFGQTIRGAAPGITFVGTEASARIYTLFENAGNFKLFDRNASVDRLTVDASGNLLVGITAATSSGKLQTGSNSLLYGWVDRGISGGAADVSSPAGFFNISGTNIGSITCGASSTTYATSSDYRLKENIAPMIGALATVSALKPVTYNWKADGVSSQGFIAHELQEVVPECVIGKKDAVNDDGSIKPQGIDTSFLVATLTAALQEAHGLIKDLQARVQALESK